MRRHWRALVIAAYALVLIGIELRHEPWFDEAQAWLLARDASPWELIAHRLHYEGSPPLWHLVLMPFAKAGLPFRTASAIGCAFAFAGVVAFVQRARLPALLVAAAPFSYFVLFQYGVVARSYCMLLLLFSLLAMLWQSRAEHPVRYAILLGLLSQVSVHGFIIMVAAVAADAPTLMRAWRGMPPRLRRAHVASALALLVLALATVIELWPTADNAGGGTWHLTLADIPTALRTFWTQAPVPYLVIPALALLVWWFHERRVLLFMGLASAGLVVLFVLRYASPWNGGVVFLLLLFGLWISWPQAGETVRAGAPRWLRPAVVAGAGVLTTTQLVWAGATTAYDVTNSYSGTAAAAAYIAQHLQGARIDAMGKWSMGILAYFPGDIFHDYAGGNGPSYWTWSKAHNALPWSWAQIVADHPDAIVDTVKSHWRTPLPCIPGYSRVAVFPGDIYFGTASWESETVVLYEPGGPGAFTGTYVISGCGSA